MRAYFGGWLLERSDYIKAQAMRIPTEHKYVQVISRHIKTLNSMKHVS